MGGLTQTTLYNTITIRAVNEIGASVKSQAMDVSVQTLAAPPDTAQILDMIRVDVVDVLVGAQDVTSTFIVSWVAHAAGEPRRGVRRVRRVDRRALDFAHRAVVVLHARRRRRRDLLHRARRARGCGGARVVGEGANASTVAENIGSSEVDYRAVATVDTLSPGRNTPCVPARNAIGQSANVTANTGTAPRRRRSTTPARADAVRLARLRRPLGEQVAPRCGSRRSTSVADIEAYQVIVDDGATPVELPQTISPQYILTGLIPGTLHTFSVAARNREGAGEYSDTFAARTADDVPGKPLADPQYLVKGERHYIEVEMQPRRTRARSPRRCSSTSSPSLSTAPTSRRRPTTTTCRSTR